MRTLLGNDRGAINFVALSMVVAVVAAVYFGIAYIPLYLDNYTIKKGVRTGCNTAYNISLRTVDNVRAAITAAYKETEAMDTVVSADGSLMKVPTHFDTENAVINLRTSPAVCDVTVSYDRRFVWPFSKKQRQKHFEFSHSESLEEIKY